MRSDDDSTLWRLSAFDRLYEDSERAAFLGETRHTMLPTTLMAELGQLRADPASNDVLEVVAMCLRHREPALLYLALGPLVWPVSLFPAERLYHAPRQAGEFIAGGGLAGLRLLEIERPRLRPPGHFLVDRVGDEAKYRALSGLVWAVALHGPRDRLLTEIGGRSAYRLAAIAPEARPQLPGALAPAVARLRQGAASLRDIAGWPGMSLERASRLLNALYLTDSLLVMHSHPSARAAPGGWRSWLPKRR